MPPNFVAKTSRWALSISPLLLGLVPWSGTYESSSPITDGTKVNGQTYDYIIAGGGLSGTVLASRLAENGDRTVLLIEAGHSAEEDPVIYRMFIVPIHCPSSLYIPPTAPPSSPSSSPP